MITHESLISVGYIYANENGQKYYWHLDFPYLELRQDNDGEWLLWSHFDNVECLITQKEIESMDRLKDIHFMLSGNKLCENS